MDLQVTGAFIYFEIPIFGGIPITQTTVSFLIVTIALCLACYFLGRDLKIRPDGKQVLVEKGVMMLRTMVVESMGEHNAHWTPFIGTIFLSSICGSFIGLTGFFRSATADISCVVVWALMVTAIIWYNNIKNNGFLGWLKGFTEPIVVMTPMNIVSEVAQPIALAFRHFGNVAGGGVLMSMVYSALAGLSSLLLGWIPNAFLSSIPLFQLGIPAVLSVYFDLFSGFIQALVFCMLTMVYVGEACPPPAEKQEPKEVNKNN